MAGGTSTGGEVSDGKVMQDTSTLVGWWSKWLVFPQNVVVVPDVRPSALQLSKPVWWSEGLSDAQS